MTQTVNIITEALHYVKKYTGQRLLIKLGGSILDDVDLIKNLCKDLSLLRAVGIQVVLVHGGSKAIEAALTAHNINWQFHQGQRITSPEMIDIIEMVLCGHVNKLLVRTLNAVDVAAVGLSGTDHNLLLCSAISPDLGRVGRIDQVNATLIENYLQSQEKHGSGIIPIIAPIGVDNDGAALNVNADLAASQIAIALNISKLIYLTDQPGIYDNDKKIISELHTEELKKLIENQTVKDGMLVKVNTILQALAAGIDDIHIISGKQPNALIAELFTDQGIGTICKR